MSFETKGCDAGICRAELEACAAATSNYSEYAVDWEITQRNVNVLAITHVVQALEDVLDVNMCAAGGCIRDILHGKTYYKDIDVFPLGNYNKEDLIIKAITKLGATYTPHYGTCTNPEFGGVLKLRMFGRSVDIILRKDKPQTGKAVIAKLDTNLNAYYYTKADGFKASPKSFEVTKELIISDSHEDIDNQRIVKQLHGLSLEGYDVFHAKREALV